MPSYNIMVVGIIT